MTKDGQNVCELCIPYLLGECSAEEREQYERHLRSCPHCRREFPELRRTWRMLPLEMEPVEVPADLKAEVMNAVFAQRAGRPPADSFAGAEPDGPVKRLPAEAAEGKKRFWRKYGFAAAILPLFIASVVWNFALLAEKGAGNASAAPAQIVSFKPFETASPAFASAKGIACILDQRNRKKLVLYLYNLPATKDSEAYQVWLMRNGQRRNAGAFRVGNDGLGVLVADLRPGEGFDSVGVTLEPNADGMEPRGRKVAGAPIRSDGT
jgi:hypothetical protein